MAAVIYARYSDSKQTEQSIEGQLKVCYKYCETNGYNVVQEYIDRAQSGKTDNRIQFRKMLADSKKKQFDTVVVYAIDRFGRNLLQSLLNEKSLQENGVTVYSATEDFQNTPAGRMQRNIHMSFAQYYSEELAQKVTRGMRINAEKGLSNGGTTPLGYRIENKRYVIDEARAPIVQEIFTKYANGWSIKQICDSLNERHLKTAQGAVFNKSSLHTMLKNRKYIGIYSYSGQEIPGGMPQIIDNDLFNKVQEMMCANKKSPARSRAKAEYLLSGKLFCGYCKEKMVGHSSNQISKKGVIFNYYKCKNSGGKKPCKKKMVHKDYIEDIIVNECQRLLTPQNIQRIAKEVVKFSLSMDNCSEIKRLESLILKAQEETENQMTSLRACKDSVIREMIFEDLSKIGTEIKGLKKQLEIEESRHYVMTEQQIVEHLTTLSEGTIHDKTYRKSLIRLFVNKIFLYDDKFTVTFNTGDEEVTITDVLLTKIENGSLGKNICISNNPVHQEKSPESLDLSRVSGDFLFTREIFGLIFHAFCFVCRKPYRYGRYCFTNPAYTPVRFLSRPRCLLRCLRPFRTRKHRNTASCSPAAPPAPHTALALNLSQYRES